MSAPSFSVIIPVFNKWELTEACLRSLDKHTAGHDYEVIVIDNASSDATATDLLPLGKELFGERFTGIRNEENQNYGPACNTGAELAASPLLFFLNNDTLLTPNWAAPLLEALAADASLGAVGPLLLYEDDTVQHLGVACGTGGLTHLYNGFPADHPVVAKKRRLQALTAAALLLPRELFLSCGGFYPGYRNGFEDVELSIRIRQQGKKLSCVPASRIYHLESQTPGRGTHRNDNAILLKERCPGQILLDLHQHGQRDNFKVVLDDGLATCLLVNDEEDQELRRVWRKASNDPALVLYGLIRKNPYWIWGHEIMAENLEQTGEYIMAAMYRSKILNMCFTRTNLERAMRDIKLSRNANMLQNTLPHMLEWENDLPSLETMTSKLNSFIRSAENNHDKLLAELCRAKQAELGIV